MDYTPILSPTSKGIIGVRPKEKIKIGRFVNSDAELAAEMAKPVSMKDVFDHWERINNPNRNGGCTADEEKNGWEYIESLNAVKCIPNSNGLVGFLSDTTHDNYTHDMQVYSTNGDNDAIVVIIAAVKDESISFANQNTPFYHTLSAVLTASFEGHVCVGPTNHGSLWMIAYDFSWTRYSKLVADGNASITDQSNTGWSTANRALGRRCKIDRKGDIITCTTSQWNSTVLDPSTTITCNLNAMPELAKFKGAQRYGYAALSQAHSYYKGVSFADVTTMIIYLSQNKCYEFIDGRWVISPDKTIEKDVGLGVFAYNQDTKKMWYIRSIGDIVNIAL